MFASSVFRVRASCAVPALLVAAVVVSFVFSSVAVASDATLAATLNTWSRTIGADAHSISLAAQRRHPRRMSFSAARFHRDALRAHAAIAAQHASSPKGRRARNLALRAYANYAKAGTLWAASGRARLQGRKPAASALARTAATYAKYGNRLLTMAGKLLP